MRFTLRSIFIAMVIFAIGVWVGQQRPLKDDQAIVDEVREARNAEVVIMMVLTGDPKTQKYVKSPQEDF